MIDESEAKLLSISIPAFVGGKYFSCNPASGNMITAHMRSGRDIIFERFYILSQKECSRRPAKAGRE